MLSGTFVMFFPYLGRIDMVYTRQHTNPIISPDAELIGRGNGRHYESLTNKEGIMNPLIVLLSGTAICILFYALFRVITLNRRLQGGIARKTWQLLYYLIGLLVAGYLATLLFPYLPEVSRQVIIGVILLAGSVFILKVINLFYRIISDIGLWADEN